MSGQTIAQLPYDLSDVTSLKRFLRELVDNLDVVLGYKGTKEGYVSTADQAQTLSDIREKIAALSTSTDSIKESVEGLVKDIEELTNQVSDQNTLRTKSALGSNYYDFNASSWAALAGRYTLSAEGSLLVNTPFTATVGTVYDVFIDSTKTDSDTHQQISVGKTTVEVYTRWGIGNAWTKLG